jgi:uncharacterized protein YbjT (DUF2867 family)
MSTKRLLTVFGATGNQGGSILDCYFASHGVEMVKADHNDPESLKAAVTGAYGVFGVTDFWAVMSKEIEIQQYVYPWL